MTPVDYVIVFLVLVSSLVGVWRGFTTEALSLVTLLAAIGLAWTFAPAIEPGLGNWVSEVEVRLWAARFIIFVSVLVIGGLISWLARKLVRHSGLTGLDRTLHDRLAVDVKSILATTRTTALWVTHDHDEALVVADRTLSLSDIGS